tara:strand:+ start:292 stop:453 length:162 start_codon:yes stop_codon:yes gene_type:complete
MSRAKKYENNLLPMGCYVEGIIENNGIFERVYKCPDGQKHFIPENLLFDIDND